MKYTTTPLTLSSNVVFCEEKGGFFKTNENLCGTGLVLCNGCSRSVHNSRHKQAYEQD